MGTSRRLWIAGLATTVLVIGACGSTLPTQQQEAGAIGITDESGDLSAGILPPGTRVNEKGQVIDAEGNVIGTIDDIGSSAPSQGFTGSGQEGGSAGRVVSSAPGVTAKTILFGAPTWSEYETAQQAVGTNLSGIDHKKAWTTLIDDINKRGGIAGRKVVVEFHEVRVTSNNWAQDAEAACADWTQDHHVYAALVEAFEQFGENFFSCMERAGAAVISGSTNRIIFDERVFERYPHYVAPFAQDVNSQATTLVNGLVRQKYFGKDAKIGLVTFDLPYYDYATERNLIPALKRHGLELSSIARIHFPFGLSAYGQTTGEAGNAALKFKTEGITHVMLLDVGGFIAVPFMQAAEKQAYRPRYGFNSQAPAQGAADQLGGDARNQLAGARVVGWWPTSDVRAADEPPFAQSPARARCLQLMRRNGVQMEGRQAEAQAVVLCDEMWVAEAIIEAGGRNITSETFILGIERLGSRYAPSQTFASRISADVRDGLGAVAPLAFFDECTCFRYTGEPYSIPN